MGIKRSVLCVCVWLVVGECLLENRRVEAQVKRVLMEENGGKDRVVEVVLTYSGVNRRSCGGGCGGGGGCCCVCECVEQWLV
ncbi:hypothetical protein K457DRAFT_138071, partial [Linnemannia elongata AG-77]